MNMFKYLKLFFLIGSVNSIVTEVNFKNLNLKTVSSLLKTLNRLGKDVKYVEVHPNSWKQKQDWKDRNNIGKDDRRNEFGALNVYPRQHKMERPDKPKRILIKRLIPHGMSPSKFEFDSKFKTIYRPLVRIHKRKPVPSVGALLNIDGGSTGRDKYGIDTFDYYDNDQNVVNFVTQKGLDDKLNHFSVKEVGSSDIDGELLQPFTINAIDNFDTEYEQSEQLKMLQKISKLLKQIYSSPAKLRTYDRILSMLDKLVIRSYYDEKSGEDNDPMAPGRPRPEDLDVSTQKPKTILHYPPWNYWTYKKTIYQDVCPKGQAKIADRCIWLPPH